MSAPEGLFLVTDAGRRILVVPDASIVKPGELPQGWGLMTLVKCDYPGYGLPDLDGLKLRTKIPAAKLNPEPVPREMLATLMRSTAKTAKRRTHDALCGDSTCSHWEYRR